MKPLVMLGTGLLILLYPLAVYFGLQVLPPSVLALLLLTAVLIRWRVGRTEHQPGNYARAIQYVPLFGALVLVISVVGAGNIGVKLYPIAINAGMLLVFGMSLLRPPTLIEMLARITKPDLPPAGVLYTRKVTWLWCGFFVINASISAWTAFAASLETWALYNGFVAYCAMGILLGGEWLYRTLFIKHH